tara:strand:- start:256 stop:513 length:258 start_codon:yes stop_codon:yes gene_type:complete
MIKYTLILSVIMFANCSLLMSPSPSREWKANRLFERCMTLDVRDVENYKKLNCWIEWTMLEKYTPPYHKTKYVHSRIQALLDGKD